MERAGESRLRYGLRYAELDYKSFPLRVRVQPGEDGELEKKLFPVLDWPRIATCDRAKVESWWGEGQPWATASIGIATAQSGISVVDCDGPEGVAKWQEIRDLYGIPDGTPHYSTPGGGEHWWYRTDPERPLPTKAHTIAHGIDTRGGYGPTGTGLVIVPPSTDDRGAYRWIVEPGPADQLPPVPEAVYALIEDRRSGKSPETHDAEPSLPGDGTRRFTLAQAQTFVRSSIDELEKAERGGRNQALNDAARLVAHFGGEFWSRDQAEQRLTDLARERGLDAAEITATIDSAYKAQARDYASGEVDKAGRPLGWTATYVEPSPFGDDDPAEESTPEEARAVRVAERLESLEVAAEAQRLFNAKHQPRADAPEPMLLPDLLELPIDPVQYRIDGLLGAGGRVLLAAAHKAGKTTLVGNLLKCLVDGGDFLGRHAVTPVEGRVVLLDTELPPRLLQDWLGRQHVENADRIAVLSLRDRVTSFDLTDPAALNRWVKLLQPLEPGFVILDCLRPVLDAAGLDERGEVGRFLVPFGELLGRLNVPEAVLVQHMGHSGERARGDSVLLGWPDANWKIVRRDAEDDRSARFFSAFGRDVDIPECELGFNSMTGKLIAIGGSRKEADGRAAIPVVLELLAERPKLSGRQIEQELQGVYPQKVIRSAVKLAIEDRSVVTEPGPHRSTLHSVR
jgi:hypothetical protein